MIIVTFVQKMVQLRYIEDLMLRRTKGDKISNEEGLNPCQMVSDMGFKWLDMMMQRHFGSNTRFFNNNKGTQRPMR